MSSSFSLAARLRAGETIFIAWCAIPSPVVAETCAREGFRAVVLDQQHGLYDMATTTAAIGAVHLAGAAPVVRVPVADFAVASRVLDLGAEGVIAPMINTEADARAFVKAVKYPPLGERSWGPVRAAPLSGLEQKDYLRSANDLTVSFAMVETRLALTNLDAIIATPGIDAIFVGPSDLSLALSNGAELDPLSKEVEAALDRIVAATTAAGKIPAVYCANAERARALAARGFRFLAVGSDSSFLRAGAGAALKTLAGA